MRLTFKFRLRPTRTQCRVMSEQLEVCRCVYNRTLAARLLPAWKAENPALKQVHSQVLQNVQIRVDLAFQAFFRRVKAGEKVGYPRFRGRGWYDSFTYPQYGDGVRLDGDVLHLSKIGTVRVRQHRPIVGEIKTVTLQRDRFDNWYACFSCEIEPEPLPPTDQMVGIDLGLKTFATLSDGHTIKRQRWMKRDADNITRLQRKKDKYPKGGPERRKVLRALNHACQRAANRRNNFAHQESRQLVNTYQVIVLEDLDIQDLQANGKKVINQGIADVAWGQFVQATRYKAESAGRTVLCVNPRGTTQMCSGCGEVVPKNLSVRVHDCPHCGLKMDRDLNAALNILARGLASLRPRPVEAPAFRRGE